MLKNTVEYLEEIMDTESYDLSKEEKESLFSTFKENLSDNFMNQLYLDVYCNSVFDSLIGEENLYIKVMKKEVSRSN